MVVESCLDNHDPRGLTAWHQRRSDAGHRAAEDGPEEAWRAALSAIPSTFLDIGASAW